MDCGADGSVCGCQGEAGLQLRGHKCSHVDTKMLQVASIPLDILQCLYVCHELPQPRCGVYTSRAGAWSTGRK